MKIDAKELRKALGAFATGVTIVTTQGKAGQDVGLTVNSFSSVSLDPPMVLWSLAKSAGSRAAFVENDCFAVHILAKDQCGLSSLFATPGADRFSGLDLERGCGDVPLIRDCSARFQCRTISRYDGGDHDIIVGEVVAYENFELPALVFLGGRYAVAVESPDAQRGDDEDLFETGMLTSLQYLLGRAHYQCQLGIRPELARIGLDEVEFYLLTAAELHGPCPVADLFRLVSVTGYKVGSANVDRLVGCGLLSLETDSAGNGTVLITAPGREMLTRVAVLLKTNEGEALKGLSPVEIGIFKQMLKGVIEKTLPDWRKPLQAR